MVLNETTYTQKDIAVTVAMDGQEAITFKDFAVSVSIDKSGCPAYPKASVVLKGLSLNTMERLTHLGFKSFSLKRNKINISAGQKGKTLSVISKARSSMLGRISIQLRVRCSKSRQIVVFFPL